LALKLLLEEIIFILSFDFSMKWLTKLSNRALEKMTHKTSNLSWMTPKMTELLGKGIRRIRRKFHCIKIKLLEDLACSNHQKPHFPNLEKKRFA